MFSLKSSNGNGQSYTAQAVSGDYMIVIVKTRIIYA